jgi:DNA replication licensing factor MCM3
MALKEIVDNINPTYAKLFNNKFFVGYEGSFGAHHVTPRGLRADLLGKLVSVEGIVSKCGLVHPKVVKSVHYCPDTTQSLERSYRDATSIDGLPTSGLYPKEDEEGHPLVTEYGLSVYKNHQTLTIQEMPERAPTGQLPRSVNCIVDDDLVDNCKPGDRVQLTGIFRALPNKTNGGTKGVFKTVLLCNKVTILGKESLTPTLTSEDIKNITKIATDENQSASGSRALSLALAESCFRVAGVVVDLSCVRAATPHAPPTCGVCVRRAPAPQHFSRLSQLQQPA